MVGLVKGGQENVSELQKLLFKFTHRHLRLKWRRRRRQYLLLHVSKKKLQGLLNQDGDAGGFRVKIMS
jgi:hypothetical protein